MYFSSSSLENGFKGGCNTTTVTENQFIGAVRLLKPPLKIDF
jgi:hypothetical protein